MTLDRQAILGADDLAVEPISIPAWGGDSFIRVMTSEERDAFELSVGAMQKGETKIQFRSALVARCLCDQDGKRLFSDSDIGALSKKSGAALDGIFDAARKLNKMTDQDVEELAKNSETCQSDDSASS